MTVSSVLPAISQSLYHRSFLLPLWCFFWLHIGSICLVFVHLWLTSLSMIPSCSIQNAVSYRISSFLIAGWNSTTQWNCIYSWTLFSLPLTLMIRIGIIPGHAFIISNQTIWPRWRLHLQLQFKYGNKYVNTVLSHTHKMRCYHSFLFFFLIWI